MEVPVAWLDVTVDGPDTLELLLQRYERTSDRTYAYQSPRFDYAAELEVTPSAFARVYPGLWREEP